MMFSEWLNKNPERISCSKLIAWVKENHYRPEDFEETNIIEKIKKYPFYELKLINVDNLKSKKSIEKTRIEKYSGLMSKSDYPPIICYPSGKIIIDGNHRLEALKCIGAKLVKAWVGIN